MSQIIGAYRVERNENLDDFYKEIGMTWIKRQMMCNQKLTMHFTKDEKEQWNFKTVYVTKTIENSFKLDEEYTDNLPNGKTLKSITSMDGDNKLVTKSKWTKEDSIVTYETQYEFNEDGMVMTMQASNAPKLVTKRYFTRVPASEPGKSDG